MELEDLTEKEKDLIANTGTTEGHTPTARETWR